MLSLDSIPQDIVWVVFAAVLLVAGVIVGFVLGWPARGRERTAEAERDTAVAEVMTLRGEIEAARTELSAARSSVGRPAAADPKVAAQAERVPALERELASLRERLVAFAAENAKAEEARHQAEEAHAERLAALTALREDLEVRMAALVEAAVQRNQAVLVDLASQLQDGQTHAAAELQAHQGAIEGLVRPVTETLLAYEQRLAALEQQTVKAATSASAARAPRRDRTRTGSRAAAVDPKQLNGQDDAPVAAGSVVNGLDTAA